MRIKSIVTMCCAVLLMVSSAYAASDGTMGTTSTGTADISVSIPDLILITKMGDIALGAYSGTGDLEGNNNVCVYTNKAGANYQVTATGDGTGSAFTISDGGTNEIPYGTFYNDVTGTTGEVALTTGSPSAQTGADTSSIDCSGGTNGNYHVVLAEADLLAAPSGSYSGTLTLVVEPN